MKKKVKFKKVLAALLMACSAICATATVAFAEEAEHTVSVAEDDIAFELTDDTASAMADDVTDDTASAMADDVTDAENVNTLPDTDGVDISTSVADNDDSFFTVLYGEVEKNISEILSALTLIGTLIVGFAYKKGLIPALSAGVKNIQIAVSGIKEEQKTEAESRRADLASFGTRLESVEKCLSDFSDAVVVLEDRLEEKARSIAERERVRLVLMSQIDMLYDIFMSSAIPQYQKDAIGDKVMRMKQELTLDEKSE